jgi:hypothetical protein
VSALSLESPSPEKPTRMFAPHGLAVLTYPKRCHVTEPEPGVASRNARGSVFAPHLNDVQSDALVCVLAMPGPFTNVRAVAGLSTDHAAPVTDVARVDVGMLSLFMRFFEGEKTSSRPSRASGNDDLVSSDPGRAVRGITCDVGD